MLGVLQFKGGADSPPLPFPPVILIFKVQTTLMLEAVVVVVLFPSPVPPSSSYKHISTYI